MRRGAARCPVAGLGAACRSFLLVLLALAFLVPSAWGQNPTGNRLLPGENRPTLPEFLPSQPTSPFEAPPPAVAPPVPGGPGPLIIVTSFRFTGNAAMAARSAVGIAALPPPSSASRSRPRISRSSASG